MLCCPQVRHIEDADRPLMLNVPAGMQGLSEVQLFSNVCTVDACRYFIPSIDW